MRSPLLNAQLLPVILLAVEGVIRSFRTLELQTGVGLGVRGVTKHCVQRRGRMMYDIEGTSCTYLSLSKKILPRTAADITKNEHHYWVWANPNGLS